MNRQEISKLYEKSKTYSIGSKFGELINSSTLSINTLKFLGTLIDNYQPQNIIEFGSGLSTYFFSEILKEKGNGHLFSIENSSEYLNLTREKVGNRGNITFFHSPISPFIFKRRKLYSYEQSFIQNIPDLEFDLVLIDGPLGEVFNREGSLYLIIPFIKSETLILLDDSNREGEQQAILNWKKVWPNRMDIIEFVNLKKGLTLITINKPSMTKMNPFTLRQIINSYRYSNFKS